MAHRVGEGGNVSIVAVIIRGDGVVIVIGIIVRVIVVIILRVAQIEVISVSVGERETLLVSTGLSSKCVDVDRVRHRQRRIARTFASQFDTFVYISNLVKQLQMQTCGQFNGRLFPQMAFPHNQFVSNSFWQNLLEQLC
jgi:hypothetical protein